MNEVCYINVYIIGRGRHWQGTVWFLREHADSAMQAERECATLKPAYRIVVRPR